MIKQYCLRLISTAVVLLVACSSDSESGSDEPVIQPIHFAGASKAVESFEAAESALLSGPWVGRISDYRVDVVFTFNDTKLRRMDPLDRDTLSSVRRSVASWLQGYTHNGQPVFGIYLDGKEYVFADRETLINPNEPSAILRRSDSNVLEAATSDTSEFRAWHKENCQGSTTLECLGQPLRADVFAEKETAAGRPTNAPCLKMEAHNALLRAMRDFEGSINAVTIERAEGECGFTLSGMAVGPRMSVGPIENIWPSNGAQFTAEVELADGGLRVAGISFQPDVVQAPRR